MKIFNVLLIFIAIILCSCGKNVQSNELLCEDQKQMIIETINAMEKKRIELFQDGQYNPEDILYMDPEKELGVLVKYSGPNDTFEEVCEEMSEFCSPRVAEILVREAYMYNIDGEMYIHAAGGMPVFSEIPDISAISNVTVEDSVYCVDIKRNYFMNSEFETSTYSVTFEDDRAYILDYKCYAYHSAFSVYDEKFGIHHERW